MIFRFCITYLVVFMLHYFVYRRVNETIMYTRYESRTVTYVTPRRVLISRSVIPSLARK